MQFEILIFAVENNSFFFYNNYSPALSYSSTTDDGHTTSTPIQSTPNQTPEHYQSYPSFSSQQLCQSFTQQPSTSTNYTPAPAPAVPASSPTSSIEKKKERAPKKICLKELAPCKALMEDLERHDDAWPFLLPVNTKQFPTYKKIIKIPMDLSTIKKRLHDGQ